MIPTTFLGVYLSILTLTPAWSFAVIGDSQANPRILLRAAADIKKRKPEFVVHVGDMGYCGSYKFWRKHRRIMRSTGVPWRLSLGNHELYQCDPKLSRYSKKRWVRFWYNDGGTAYRAFTHRGVKFVLLDTANVWTSPAQATFLKRHLRGARSAFLFGHRPLPYPSNPKLIFDKGRRWVWYRYMGPARHGWGGFGLWRTVYRNRARIKAYFHGHHHSRLSYRLSGLQVHCTGGGGGHLETTKDTFHYLMVTITGGNYSVKTIPLGI